MKDHTRFLFGWRASIIEQKPRILKSRMMDEMPMAASMCILGSPLTVFSKTRYGASLVFIPLMPNAVGICVDKIVMPAEVTNADIGIYGMNSMIQPNLQSPKNSKTAPVMKLRAWATSIEE